MLKLVEYNEKFLTANKLNKFFRFEDNGINRKLFEILKDGMNDYKPNVNDVYEIEPLQFTFDEQTDVLSISVTTILDIFQGPEDVVNGSIKLYNRILIELPRLYEDLKKKST